MFSTIEGFNHSQPHSNYEISRRAELVLELRGLPLVAKELPLFPIYSTYRDFWMHFVEARTP